MQITQGMGVGGRGRGRVEESARLLEHVLSLARSVSLVALEESVCVCVVQTHLWVCNMWYSQLRNTCVHYAVLYAPVCVL